MIESDKGMKKQIVIVILSSIVGGILGYLFAWNNRSKDLQSIRARQVKFEDYFAIVNKWLKLKNAGGKLQDFFIENGYKRIGIYGMGELGKRLYEELRCSDVEMVFAMDKGGYNLPKELNMLTENAQIPLVDVIVVTPTFDYENIANVLKQKTQNKIISISEIFA